MAVATVGKGGGMANGGVRVKEKGVVHLTSGCVCKGLSGMGSSLLLGLVRRGLVV